VTPPGTEVATGPAPALPLLIVATREEAAGASRKVAGLTVLERAVKQARRLKYQPIIASDATVPVPAGVDLRTVAGRGAVEDFRRSLGATAIPGDVVRPSNRDLEGGVRVVDDESRARAEDAIFAELLRGDLGFVARYLNKPVSFRITRHLLCHLPFTPNQVTLGAAVIGLFGCALIATGLRWLVVLGFLLAHFQSVLDGCDGELARVRFQQSAIGEWLDTIVDDGLNLGLVASMGIGLGRAYGSTFPTIAGFVTCGMLLTYNAVAYRELVRQGEGGEVLKVRWWFLRGADVKELVGKKDGKDGKKGSLALRFVTTVARRDFFVLAWFVLAALGLFPVVLVYAMLVVIPSFVVAIGQLVLQPSRHNR
jgi:phosphatidylglycerophosphate synthase